MDDRQYIYQAEGGLQAAADFLVDVSQSPNFPEKFRSRVDDLIKRVRRVLLGVRGYADAARGRRARVEATEEPLKLLRAAKQGLENTVDGLHEAVVRGGAQYRGTLRQVREIQDAVGILIEDVSEFSEVDEAWAALQGGLSNAVRGLDEWLFGRRPPAARPALVARGKAKKDVGHGGLDEWFSGHGGGEGEARWGDWVAISPVKKKIKKELADGTVKKETVYPGDIIGPCGISEDPNWKDLTNKGKDPLKCMPRQKAYDMPKEERAELAKEKMRAEKKDRGEGKSTTHTRTFEKESALILAGDNEPTNPKLWEKAKNKAKSRYDKWPSAYAVGHALKVYKDEGGGWRKKAARPIRIDRAEVQRVSGLALVEFEKLLRDVPEGASFVQVYRRAYYEGQRPFTRFESVDVRGRPFHTNMYIGLQGIPRGAVVAGVSGDKQDLFILANSLMPKAELLKALRKEMMALVAHEVTHLVDVLPDMKMKEMDPVLKTEEAARAYFNRLPEVRGWMRHIYEEIREEVHRAQAAGTNLGRAITDALTRSPLWRDASPYLSPKNRKTMLKGLVTAFEDDAAEGHGIRTAKRVGAAPKRQVQYKGRPYNLLWSGPTKYGERAHLQFLDGSKDFWVDSSLVSGGSSRIQSPRLRRDGTYECEECGEYVRPGTQCWETGIRH